MKSILLKLFLCLTLVFSFSACSKNEEKVKEPSSQSSSEKNNTKYGDANVYEKNGVPHAKTESGEEIEISGDNFAELISEYEKVKGSGSAKEKELLDKIQLILEAPRN